MHNIFIDSLIAETRILKTVYQNINLMCKITCCMSTML